MKNCLTLLTLLVNYPFGSADHENENENGMGCFQRTKSSFKVYNINKGKSAKKCHLHSDLANSLTANGFVKVMCPFGILLVATEKYPDEVRKR